MTKKYVLRIIEQQKQLLIKQQEFAKAKKEYDKKQQEKFENKTLLEYLHTPKK